MRTPSGWKHLPPGILPHLFLASVLLFLLGITVSHAEPRSPMPALPQAAIALYHNRFDEPYWFDRARSTTLQMEFGTLVESWSGYAFQRSGRSVRPFVVPALNERGYLNVACDSGSVGFWFKPYWSSAAVNAGETPGTIARLIDLVVIGASDAAVGWSLQVSADGNALQLLGANGERVLGKEIAWRAGEWHWIVLNYGERGTALYLDDGWAAEGDATIALPAKYAGLVLGSSVLGDEVAGGEFEDFYCYRRQMRGEQPSFGYEGNRKRAAMGAVTAAELETLAKWRAERKALKELSAISRQRSAEGEQPEEGGGEMMLKMMLNTTTCVTNSPLYITNTVCVLDTNTGWTVTFDIQGTNSPADIFTTTTLGTTNAWTWLERGPSCATYQYTNQPNTQAFFILGTMLDTDADGLTDAYEKLVSKTLINNPDTDGDGISDRDEVVLGTNPLVNEIALTSGRMNYQYNFNGWLTNAAGIWNKGLGLDAEGNVTGVTP